MTQPQQHCEHEGWCWHQILGCKPLEDGKPKCVRDGCEGDTRPHTPAAPAAPEPFLQDGEEPEEICKRKPICAHYPCGMEKIDSYCGMKMRLALQAREQVLEWAKQHHWPTTGGHRVIGFDKLKEFLESLRGGA